MIAIRPTYIILFFALFVFFHGVTAELTFSIKGGYVPNLQYQVDAIECVKEAYILHPDNGDNQRNEAISKLYLNRHNEKNGWNIAEGCLSSYSPNSTIFVEVLIKDSDTQSETVVKIFN